MVVDIFPAPTNDTVVPIPTPLVRPTPIFVVASKKYNSFMGVATFNGVSSSYVNLFSKPLYSKVLFRLLQYCISLSVIHPSFLFDQFFRL